MPANPSWYDILGLPRDATPAQVKAAWREATDRFEPGSGHAQFRLFNEAADVLLDPARRAAYDAELGPDEGHGEPSTSHVPVVSAPTTIPVAPAPGTASRRQSRTAPSRALVTVVLVLAVLAACAVAGAVVMTYKAHRDSLVEDARTEAPATAERALESVLSYDYRHMGADEKRAARYLTSRYKQQNHFAATYRMLARGKGGDPSAVESTKAVVTAHSEASAVVDAAPDLARVLVFVNQTSRKAGKQPVIFQNRVVVTMVRSGNGWLVDDLKSY